MRAVQWRPVRKRSRPQLLAVLWELHRWILLPAGLIERDGCGVPSGLVQSGRCQRLCALSPWSVRHSEWSVQLQLQRLVSGRAVRRCGQLDDTLVLGSLQPGVLLPYGFDVNGAERLSCWTVQQRRRLGLYGVPSRSVRRLGCTDVVDVLGSVQCGILRQLG